MYACELCSKTYTSTKSLAKHKKNHQPPSAFCHFCQFATHRPDVLRRHITAAHPQRSLLEESMADMPSTSGTQRQQPSSSTATIISDMERQIKELRKEVEEMKKQNKRKADTDQSSSKKAKLSTQTEDVDGQLPGPSWRPDAHVDMNRINGQLSKRMKSAQGEFEVKIKPSAFDIDVIDKENFHEYQHRLTQIFQFILDKARDSAPPNAQGWMSIDFEGLKDKKGKHNRYINTRYTSIHDITVDDIMFEIERTLNSDKVIKVSNGFKVFIIFTELPSGSGHGQSEPFEQRTPHSARDFRRDKDSLIDVAKYTPLDDKMCLARCLVVGQFIADQGKSFTDAKGYSSLVESRGVNTVQARKAKELHTVANVPMDRPSGIPELEKFHQVLDGYQIFLYESHGTTELIYPPEMPVENNPKRIYLWLYDGHYALINPHKVAGFLGMDYYCHQCHQGWLSSPKHLCTKAVCKLCHLPNCRNENILHSQQPVHCARCNRDWPSKSCKFAHEAKMCDREAKCLKCLATVPRAKLEPPDLHHCMLNRCRYCSQYKKPGHTHCYVQKPKGHRDLIAREEEDVTELLEMLGGDGEDDEDTDLAVEETEEQKEKRKLNMADIESEVDPVTHDHQPTLLIIKNESRTKKWTYRGENCIDQFVKDLMEKDEFKNTTFAFHNLSGYDGMFILKGFYKEGRNPNAIFRSSKVLTMSLKKRKIKFIDTLLHLSMPLARLPFAYNFEDQAVKGFFPILFATKENRGYVGDLPDMKYFDPDNMSKKKYKEFVVWYKAERERYDRDPTLRYNLQEEMEKYCEADVDVLSLGFQKYRETYMDLYDGIDPADFITLPSYINHCYRALSMPQDSIPILPPRGYDPNCRQSKTATTWLEWEAKQHNITIKHSRNSNEVKIGPYYVDGFFDGEDGSNPKVWEFNGCKYHGCRKCQKDRNQMFKGKTLEERYNDTEKREKFLTDSGYDLTVIWECEFWKKLRENPEMEAFVIPLRKKLIRFLPLCPRDSLRGGRTNAIRMSYEPKRGERLSYKDFTSLYPSVNMCIHGQLYPVGHPQIFLHSFPDIENIFGLVKAIVKPPPKLFMPVLPVFANGKVIFGLCGTCIAQGNNSQPCTHSEEERCIENTFVSVELQKAIEVGYEVVEIIEIWNWPEEQRSSTLYREFLKKSYVQKVEASGWPKDYRTEEERRAYLKRYKDEQNIVIEYENVVENKPKRENSKLSINNFWGYFGKSPNEGRTIFTSSYAQYLKIFHDHTKKITATYLVNKNLMAIEFKTAEGYEQADPKTNTVMACFTTAHARMQLLGQMEQLGDRVLYFDTDSIIYIEREGQPGLESGPLLGQLTDEILEKYGPNAKISKFCAAGPKTYMLVIVDKQTNEKIDVIMKHKGIKPTMKNANVLSSDAMANMVETKSELMVDQMNMTRNRKVGSVKTSYMQKRLRVTFSKRILPETNDSPSLPIGFKT